MNNSRERDIIKENFEKYLKECGVSEISIKNYLSDLTHFSNWLKVAAESWGASPENLTELTPFINSSTGGSYKKYLSNWSSSINTANRKLATLRHFFKFLYSNEILSFNFGEALQNIEEKKSDNETINNFKEYLKKEGFTKNTIKNYLSDVRSFLEMNNDDLSDINKKTIEKFKDHIQQTSTPSTIKRKMSSLRKFFDWAKDHGLVDTHPIPSFPQIVKKSILIPSQTRIVISKNHSKYLEVIKYPVIAFSFVMLIYAVSQLINLRNSPVFDKKSVGILQEEVKGTSTASKNWTITALKKEIVEIPSFVSSNIVDGVLKTGEVIFDSIIYVVSLFSSPLVKTSTISPLVNGNIEIQVGNSDIQRSGELIINNEFGEKIASFDSSGDTMVAGLAISNSTDGYSLSQKGEVLTTEDTAGKATIPSNAIEIKINNSKIEEDSLIYVTPLSSTLNKVLYVKSRNSCENDACTPYFIVGFSEILGQEVEFNWWIVQVN